VAEGIHISTKSESRFRSAVVQPGNDTMGSNSVLMTNAIVSQDFSYHGSRFFFLSGKFRMSVQMASPGDYLGSYFPDSLIDRFQHEFSVAASCGYCNGKWLTFVFLEQLRKLNSDFMIKERWNYADL
jgi:hypothetical protein